MVKYISTGVPDSWVYTSNSEESAVCTEHLKDSTSLHVFVLWDCQDKGDAGEVGPG